MNLSLARSAKGPELVDTSGRRVQSLEDVADLLSETDLSLRQYRAVGQFAVLLAAAVPDIDRAGRRDPSHFASLISKWLDSHYLATGDRARSAALGSGEAEATAILSHSSPSTVDSALSRVASLIAETLE